MPTRERRLDRAAWLMARDLDEIGRELRIARLRAGLPLRVVAGALGASPQTVLRDERPTRGVARDPVFLARHAATVGLRIRLKAYPEGDPIRDVAQIDMQRVFRQRLPGQLPFLFEVPVTNDPSDRRAWDAVVELPGSPPCRCALEFITRFHDCQAELRDLNLKLRDGDVDRLIVVVKATHANRRALKSAAVVVASAFPLGTRAVMRALAAGVAPPHNGLVLL